MTNADPLPTISILGCRLDITNWQQVMERANAMLNSSGNQIVTLNGEIVLEANKNGELKKAINDAELVVTDSANIVWASRWIAGKNPGRTPGVDLVDRLCQLARNRGLGVFFLGGFNGVAEEAAKKLQEKYPKLIISGTSEANPNDPNISSVIKNCNAKIVFVAYGAPKQEIWIQNNKSATSASILVGIGGAFEMISGRLPRAPKIFRLLSLEWLWRLILQPSRITRIWKALVIFPFRVLFSSK